MDQLVNDQMPFNWSDLLTLHLKVNLTNSLNPLKDEQVRFHMSTYLLDAICARHQFLGMDWTWTPTETTVNLNCNFLSIFSYQRAMVRLTNHFIILVYKLIFEHDPPCMSQEVMEGILNIADWYASPSGTFIRVFGKEKPSHILPRYAMNKLVMQEVSYQIFIALSTRLHRKKKESWPTLPLWIKL